MIQTGVLLLLLSFIVLAIQSNKKSELILGIGLTLISTIYLFVTIENELNQKK